MPFQNANFRTLQPLNQVINFLNPGSQKQTIIQLYYVSSLWREEVCRDAGGMIEYGLVKTPGILNLVLCNSFFTLLSSEESIDRTKRLNLTVS